LRRAQETLLVSWTKGRYWLQALSVGFEGVLMLVSYGLVVLLVYEYLAGDRRASLVLLVVFWALRFPILGQRLLILSRSFPSAMNKVRRLLDIIGEVKDEPHRELGSLAPASREDASGVAIAMENVRIKGGGHTILDKVALTIAPGEHVAIVGVSGAGKSTLVGLLLGWLRPVRGQISVDGQVLDQAGIERLRRMTAWVDPAISIWNQSLLDNLRYGTDAASGWSIDAAIRGAEMLDILEALPEGLQTSLGEGGGLVSGGQGQRVRLARAMLRSNVRLAILDEPFRGLARERRARLLAESRRLWANITLLCVTHDVAHTQEFDRVLVIEHGRVVENGSPKELLASPSRYAELLRADTENHSLLWGGANWRHWWLADGRLVEKPLS
jgi:ABC-type multidrug transport system fused ATPase/permease subunit